MPLSFSHTLEAEGLDTQQVWAVVSDPSTWSAWNPKVKSAELLSSAFVAGGRFRLVPDGGPAVVIRLLSVEAPTGFVDCTDFPLARMYGIHTHEATERGVQLTITMKFEGLLAGLWYRLVGRGIVQGLPGELQQLVDYCRQHPQP